MSIQDDSYLGSCSMTFLRCLYVSWSFIAAYTNWSVLLSRSSVNIQAWRLTGQQIVTGQTFASTAPQIRHNLHPSILAELLRYSGSSYSSILAAATRVFW